MSVLLIWAEVPSMNFLTRFGRRDLFERGGALLAGLGLTGRGRPAAGAQAATSSSSSGGSIYRAIGVRPVVNGRGTFTIITGSQTLPEVKRAMDEASRSYVNMDELMNGVSRRLADISGAEWGIVTAGCAAGMTHTTAACIAGSNPERMQRLPDLTGLKNEVVIPGYSRNVYDHAIRMLGVKIVEVRDPADLASAFNARTAMAYILAGPGDDGPLGTAAVAAEAKKHGVPVLVDAAAEILTIPNVHLGRGATVVAYSGGKCLRGPQCAGVLLGDKSLLQAAWLNSAPHHAFGRSLKVGKEEIMGMLAAVEAWPKRDHKAEWDRWQGWLDGIARRVESVPGVTTKVLQPDSLSNRTPSLRIFWDGGKLGITGSDVVRHLLDTEPRIVVGGGSGSRPDALASTITITPYMMIPGDETVIAERLYATLAHPPALPRIEPAQPAAVSVAGQWDVTIDFTRGSAAHTFTLEQKDDALVGSHRGEFLTGDLKGAVSGSDVRFRSSHRIEGTRLSWDFTGTASGDTMQGQVSMEEYGTARWSAVRHRYRTPGGVVRPVKGPAEP
jgi:D-glucosaminate-6-phosphate ammonia-lyase